VVLFSGGRPQEVTICKIVVYPEHIKDQRYTKRDLVAQVCDTEWGLHLNPNATPILYPYVRAIVKTRLPT